MVTVLYFAGLRENLGVDRESLALPEGVADLGALRHWLAARGGEWERLNTTPNLRFAVNQTMARVATPVGDGDEVAFFPPVTGG